jgi:hypothetical protein
MKTILVLLVLLSGISAGADQSRPRILENEIAKVSLSLHERLEAEPVSKPMEIRILVECKKGYLQKKKSEVITVCSAQLQDSKGISLDTKNINLFHFEWDAKKSSNNMEGTLYCDSKKRFSDVLALADFCETTKK